MSPARRSGGLGPGIERSKHPSSDALHPYMILELSMAPRVGKLRFIIHLNHPLELCDGLARIPCLGRWVVRTLRFIQATPVYEIDRSRPLSSIIRQRKPLCVVLTCERLHSGSAASSDA